MEYNNEKFLNEFKEKMTELSPKKVLFVCSAEYDRYGYRQAIDETGIPSVAFTDFEPCPEVSSVEAGIKKYKAEKCDFVVAVGGGSAIDTAKGIKYHSKLDFEILAVPTTAGTGAEVTRFSVLYRNRDKESVNSYDIIPEYYILDCMALKSLPREQKIVTALDAYCHSIEAFWSTDATDESRQYSIEAIFLFNDNFEAYIANDESTYEPMSRCSLLAGKAINLARTASPHAFSYKLHKIRNFHHGRAVAVCLAYIWKYMRDNSKSAQLDELLEMTESITGYTPESFTQFLNGLGMFENCEMTADEFKETVCGVNTDRLKNNPMQFTDDDIKNIYAQFIKITE